LHGFGERTKSRRARRGRQWAALGLAALEREIDARSLTFEDRIRYEIARLKLLRAQAQWQTLEDDTAAGDILAAFEALQRLLAHGVPPTSREIPGFVEQPLIDFFRDAIQELHCDGLALPATERLAVWMRMMRVRRNLPFSSVTRCLALDQAGGQVARSEAARHRRARRLCRYGWRKKLHAELGCLS